MAEMHASLEQLAHREVRKRHNILRFVRRGPVSLGNELPRAGATGRPKAKIRV
jgi:hypothetical protein